MQIEKYSDSSAIFLSRRIAVKLLVVWVWHVCYTGIDQKLA